MVQSYRSLPVVTGQRTPGVIDGQRTPGVTDGQRAPGVTDGQRTPGVTNDQHRLGFPQTGQNSLAAALSLCTPVSVATRVRPSKSSIPAMATPSITPGVAIECPVCLLQRIQRAKNGD